MPSFTTISAVFASALTFASAAFDASSKTNVVYYWGQGNNQADLTTACSNPSVDIVVLGFIHIFPDQGPGGFPGSDFGNACSGATYTNNGVVTALQKDCPGIQPGIKACQAGGKKVLLSLGGGFPANGYLKSQASAEDFADFLWGAFGPQTVDWVANGNPRPCGDASVNGFDFDIETGSFPTTPTDANGNTLANPESFGYNFMIDRLRSHYSSAKGKFYISGAPQCVLPDAHLSDAIAASHFDFLFVQLYNTDQCSARAALTNQATPTLPDWESIKKANPNVRIYLGLPASKTASSKASYYLTPAEVDQLARPYFAQMPHFGGIMLWEATSASNNLDGGCGEDYTWWMKEVLNNFAANQPFSSLCSGSSSSSSISSSTSSTISSSSTVSSDPSVSSTSSYGTSLPYDISSSSSVNAAPVLISTTSSYSSESADPVLISTSSSVYCSSSSSDLPYGPYGSSSSSIVIVDPVSASSTSSEYYYPTSSSSVVVDPVAPLEYYYPPGSNILIKPTLASLIAPYYDPDYVITATVITTAYVDICPTGLTTISTMYTAKVHPHSSAPAVPEGWTTTVTVFDQETITLTKPIANPVATASYSSTEVQAVTMTIVPVPAKSFPVKPVVFDLVSSASFTPPYPFKPAGDVQLAPVEGVAYSSNIAKPVAESRPYKPLDGTAAPTGSWSKTSSGPYAQFTGAANKVNVGAGVLVGLVGAVFAM